MYFGPLDATKDDHHIDTCICFTIDSYESFIDILVYFLFFQMIIANNKFYTTTRLTTLGMCFPKITPTGPTVLLSNIPENVLDLSTMTTIPSESTCREMISTIRLGTYPAVSCNLGIFDEKSLQTLLNVHKLHEVSAQVIEEIEWLGKEFKYPDHSCATTQEDLHTFKCLLMDKPDDSCVFEYNNTIIASDFATLVGTRWLHYSVLSGIVKLLQQESSRTCTFLLNDLLLMNNETLHKQISKTVQRKPTSLTFISLVGKSNDVFLSSPKRKGCHWTMTYVDFGIRYMVLL